MNDVSGVIGDTKVPAGAPFVLFTDVESGPNTGGPGNNGVPISIYGKSFGATRGKSKVTIGGIEVAGYLVWGENNAHNPTLDMIVVQPGANVKGGPVVVTVNGKTSNSNHGFIVNSQNVYYISTEGTNTDDCSLDSPCATIQYVLRTVMSPGDTVLMRRGEYDEGEIWIRDSYGHSGLPGLSKTVKNYPGEEVYLINGDRPFINSANYITISGLNFRNGKAIGMGGVTNKGNKAIDNTFQGVIGYDAIGTHGDDVTLAGNVCDVDGSSQGTQGHCYYISAGSNIDLLYNIGKGAAGYQIHIFDQERSGDVENNFQRVIKNVLVEGNILTGSPLRSGMIVAMADEGNLGNHIENITIRNNIFAENNFTGLQIHGIADNIKVYNNTFYQNGRQGIYIADTSTVTGVDIRNNIIDQSPNSNCQFKCSWYPEAHIQVGSSATQNVVINNNLYWPVPPNIINGSDADPVTGEPLFINPAAGDFHIQQGSAAIDTGLTLTEVPTDRVGVSRPQGPAYDIGAYEFF